MSTTTSIADVIAQERIAANAQNKAKALTVLAQALQLLREGGTSKETLALFGRDERKRLNSYATRHGVKVADVFGGMISGKYTIGEVAEGIFTDAGRQSDGEKHFQRALQETVSEQACLLDPNGSFVHKLPASFLNNGINGAEWKGLDFHIQSFGIHELFSHKYNNRGGGSQTSGHHEIQRLATASSPYDKEMEIAGDWERHHYPEQVENYFREGLVKRYDCHVNGIILAPIQDGVGREKDITLMQKISKSSLYQGSPLIVFPGNREHYFMARPLLFILMRGWNCFSQQQQQELSDYVQQFHDRWPDGLAGLYANPTAPWEVLEKID